MRVFADASALVPIIAQEPDALALSDRFGGFDSRLYSAMSAWETVTALCRSHDLSVEQSRGITAKFMRGFDFTLVAIGEHERELALHAYARYGKGRHKAALNMGDCFAYACAKANGARLLFKGEDFALTDVERA